MRAPPNYGQVYKLSGRRNNPWAFRVKTGEHLNDCGSVTAEYEYKGFYKTRRDAFEAREKYNAMIGNDTQGVSQLTFQDVYEQWSERKFRNVAASTVKNYESSYNKCKVLHEKNISDIRATDLQAVVDNIPGDSAKEKMKVLMNQVFTYALKMELVDRNCAQGVEVNKIEASNKHYKFSNEDIRKLWAVKDDDRAKIVLVLCYTGLRPGELLNMTRDCLDLDEMTMTVVDGKNKYSNRTIPIPDKIQDILTPNDEWAATVNGEHYTIDVEGRYRFMDEVWNPVLSGLGILVYTHPKTKEFQQHLPHDTRHTFTSRWKELKLDEGMRRKIQGHTGNGIGEQVYTHYDTDVLREEINRLDY